jgi:hypothetical protein
MLTGYSEPLDRPCISVSPSSLSALIENLPTLPIEN